MITFDNVSYRYANTDHDAVRNISFTVKPGELKIVTGGLRGAEKRRSCG